MALTVTGAVTVPLAASRAATPAAAGSCGKWMNPHQSPDKRADELVAAMTTAQKLDLLHQHGADGQNYGAAGYVPGNAALCLPPLLLNDAGSGLADEQTGVTAYPAAISQVSSWDPALQSSLGKSLGGEAFHKGIDILLAPDVNIARLPQNGRTSEAYGEDPYLSGKTAVAYIRGVQSKHVIAEVKHYDANNQETDRGTVDERVGERALNEIYHPAFKAAVQQGHVGSVMCSYNRVNGAYACQNKPLLRHDLDAGMGFKGFVVSDWGATHSTVASTKNGLDMEMGVIETTDEQTDGSSSGINVETNFYAKPLAKDVADHKVPISRINEMVHRILRSMFAVGVFDHPPAAEPAAFADNVDNAATRKVATKAAEAGSVLLKNSHHVLPIAGQGRSIAVIGSDASTSASDVSQAGGSVHVNQPDVVTPLQGLTTRAAKDGDTVTYSDGTDVQAAAAAAKAADVAVVDIGYVEAEGKDLTSLGYTDGVCSITCVTHATNANALVKAVAAANPHTVVVLNTGGPAEMPWLSKVSGVLEAWYPGEGNGTALAALLFGDVNPAGKLPITFPKSLSHTPVHSTKQWPGVHSKAHYTEGLRVGYRWYDATHHTPLFPFGFGLSYSTFAVSHLHLHATASGVNATYRVTNTGNRTGAEVVQAYLHDPASSHEPPRQLKAYHRSLLRAGQSKHVTLHLANHAFAHYSTAHHGWQVSKGCYTVELGNSSRHHPLHARVARAGGTCPKG
jgi:beta-glucosidase